MGGGHFHQLFKAPGIGKGTLKAYAVGHRRYGQLGVGEKLLGFVYPEFRYILVDGHAGVLLEKLTEIIFGKTDAVADGVNVQIVLIIFLYVFYGCIDRRILDGGHILGCQNILGQLVKLQQQLMDQRSGFQLGHENGFGIGIIQLHETEKEILHITQLIGMKETVVLSDQIVKLLRLGTVDNHVEKIPGTVPGLGKGQGRVAGGQDHIIRVHRIPGAVLGKRHGSEGIQKEIVGIFVGSTPHKFSVIDKSYFLDVKRQCLDLLIYDGLRLFMAGGQYSLRSFHLNKFLLVVGKMGKNST